MNALLARRLDHLRGTLAELDARARHERHNLFVAEVHLDALVGAVRAGVAEVEQAADEHETVLRLTEAERAWQLVRWVLDSRRDPAVGRWLQLADLWVADGYTALASAAGLTDAVPPLVVPEAAGTPLVYRREQETEVPSLWAPAHRTHADFRVRLDLPVVLYPPDQVASPWYATTLMHELGHELVRQLRLAGAVGQALARAGGDRQWGLWSEELLCDAIAVVLSGPAYGRTLARVLAEYPALEHASRAYPDRRERLAVVAAVGAALGDDPAPLADALVRFDADPGGYDAVAAALLDTRLGTTPLRDAVEDRGAWCAALPGALAADRADAGPVTWRSLPAAAALRVADDTSADDLEAVAQGVLVASMDLPRPPWVRSAADWALVAATLRELAPTIRDRDGGKGSPAALFAAAETLAFVAATNERLPGWLDDAFEQRGGRPWRRVDVVFLGDAGLRALWGDEAGARQAARDAARALLEARLPELATAWSVGEVAHAHFFASYYDHEARLGRIHASWAVPGTADLRFTPSADYVWAGEEPPLAYVVFSRGLEVLRAGAERGG